MQRELEGNAHHVQAVHRHPRRAVGLIEISAGWERRAAVEDADVVEAQEAALEDVVAALVLAIHPPREVEQQLDEDLLEKADVARVAALQPVGLEHAPRRPGVHGRVHVAKRPFVRGELPVGVHVPVVRQEQQLLLGKLGVDHGQGDAVEREVPRGEPGVLPLVGHREHVARVEVPPVGVAAARSTGWRSRLGRIARQPAPDVEAEELLRPEHAGERLPLHVALVGTVDALLQRRVKLVGLATALVEYGVEGVEADRICGRMQDGPRDEAAAGRNRAVVVGGGFRAARARAHGIHVPLHDALVDGVLEGSCDRLAVQTRHVRFVLAEIDVGRLVERDGVAAEFGMVRLDLAGPDGGQQRPGMVRVPRPSVAEPDVRKQVQIGGLRTAVVRGHLHEDLLGVRLGVLDHDVEVAVVVEHASVDDLELAVVRPSVAIAFGQRLVRKLPLRILVEHPHVRVRRCRVDVVVQLLDVFAMVALGIGETEEPLLQDRVAAVPERHRHAEELLVVADAADAVFAPPIRAAAGVVVAEVIPRRSPGAVVFADRPPLALAQVGPPLAPRGAVPGFGQSSALGVFGPFHDGDPPETLQNQVELDR